MREAWLADTILLMSKHLKDAVLTGGSGARNLTKVYRLTNDVDLDTQEDNFESICNQVRSANKTIGGGNRSLEGRIVPGLITFIPKRNVKATFEGENRLAPFARWTTEKAYLKIHIMHVPDMPELFTNSEKVGLESVIPLGESVTTVSRECLFYRKALRACSETRAEDFLDLTFLLTTATSEQRKSIENYCAKSEKKEMVKQGLRFLISKKGDFVSQVETRLTYVSLSKPPKDWVKDAAMVLDHFREALQ